MPCPHVFLPFLRFSCTLLTHLAYFLYLQPPPPGRGTPPNAGGMSGAGAHYITITTEYDDNILSFQWFYNDHYFIGIYILLFQRSQGGVGRCMGLGLHPKRLTHEFVLLEA